MMLLPETCEVAVAFRQSRPRNLLFQLVDTLEEVVHVACKNISPQRF